jgi:hypothetical protein
MLGLSPRLVIPMQTIVEEDANALKRSRSGRAVCRKRVATSGSIS